MRWWFKASIDHFGIVPAITYVSVDEYQYAKAFEKKQSRIVGHEPKNKNSILSRSYEHIKIKPIFDKITTEKKA